MGRKSSVVIHPHRKDVENALIEGDSYRDIAERFGLSVSSVHRFATGPFASQMRDAAHRIDDTQASDVLSRVMGIADDAAILRGQAIEANNPALAIKVSAAELRALGILSGLMGLDSGTLIDEAADATKAAREFARAVVLASRKDSTVGEAVLDALRADGSTSTATRLEAILRSQASVTSLQS